MAKDRSESERKERKERKRKEKDALANVEENGVKKHKKEKSKSKDVKPKGATPPSNDDSSDGGNVLTTPVTDESDDEKENSMQIDVEGKTPLAAAVPFANPMADDKAMKKVLKGVKKSAKHKTLKRGVKEVVKSLRKSTGSGSSSAGLPPAIVVLAADISPLDVISHIPVLCEDHDVPYIFVPSRAELGAAGATKRPTSVVMIIRDVPKKKEGAADSKSDGDEPWEEVYEGLVKVARKAGQSVRI